MKLHLVISLWYYNNKKCANTNFHLFVRYTAYLWHIKTYIFWSGSSKKAILLNLTTLDIQCGHQIVVMSTKRWKFVLAHFLLL